MYIHHILFTFSSTDWHLTCFYLLANVNALNMDGQIFVQITAFNSFEYMPRSGSYGNSIFNFLRNLHFVFHAAAPFHILISRAQELQFLHLLANICYFLFVWIIAILLSEMVSWFWFAVFILSSDIVMLSIFSCVYWSFICLLWRNV